MKNRVYYLTDDKTKKDRAFFDQLNLEYIDIFLFDWTRKDIERIEIFTLTLAMKREQ